MNSKIIFLATHESHSNTQMNFYEKVLVLLNKVEVDESLYLHVNNDL